MGGEVHTVAARHSQAGRNARRKRYCRRCGTRVSRSAGRCGYCGRLLLSPARLALIAFTAGALLLFLGRLLSFF